MRQLGFAIAEGFHRPTEYAVCLGITFVDEDEFVILEGFDKVAFLPFAQPHEGVDLGELCPQLPNKEQRKASMDQDDARLAPFRLVIFEVCAEEVDEQEQPEEIAPWERQVEPCQPLAAHELFRVLPDDKEVLEVTVLRKIDPVVDLVERAKEDEQQASGEEKDRQPQRGKKSKEVAHGFKRGRRSGADEGQTHS